MIKNVYRRIKKIRGALLTWEMRYPLLSTAKFLPVYALFFIYARLNLDPDFGWHLQTGDYIRNHGVPAHDIYTYTAPHYSWINHEWGNDVLLSFIYQHLGYLGAAIIFSAIWALGFFIVAKKANWIVLLMATIAVLPYSGIRPIAWTFLGLGLLIKLSRHKSPYIFLSFPIIFMIWANLHGGFIVGLFFLAYMLVRHQSLRWALALLGSILATLLNPYGPRLYVEVARTLTDGSMHWQVAEWHPFAIAHSAWPYLWVWATGFWILKKNRLSNWFSFEALALAASFSATKNVPLFVLSSIESADSFLLHGRRHIPKNLNLPRKVVLGAVAFFVLAGMGYFGTKALLSASSSNVLPAQQIAYLNAHGCKGRIFNDYDYGGYLIWKLPGSPIFIDGRMSTWREPSGVKYMDTYFDVIQNKSTRQIVFQQYNIGCALLKISKMDIKTIRDLEKEGWVEKVNANYSVLLVKKGGN